MYLPLVITISILSFYQRNSKKKLYRIYSSQSHLELFFPSVVSGLSFTSLVLVWLSHLSLPSCSFFFFFVCCLFYSFVQSSWSFFSFWLAPQSVSSSPQKSSYSFNFVYRSTISLCLSDFPFLSSSLCFFIRSSRSLLPSRAFTFSYLHFFLPFILSLCYLISFHLPSLSP